MSSAPKAIQYGTPDAAPLLKIQSAGPRIDVPGYRNISHSSSGRTAKPRPAQAKKTGKPGVGRLVDVTA